MTNTKNTGPEKGNKDKKTTENGSNAVGNGPWNEAASQLRLLVPLIGICLALSAYLLFTQTGAFGKLLPVGILWIAYFSMNWFVQHRYTLVNRNIAVRFQLIQASPEVGTWKAELAEVFSYLKDKGLIQVDSAGKVIGGKHTVLLPWNKQMKTNLGRWGEMTMEVLRQIDEYLNAKREFDRLANDVEILQASSNSDEANYALREVEERRDEQRTGLELSHGRLRTQLTQFIEGFPTYDIADRIYWKLDLGLTLGLWIMIGFSVYMALGFSSYLRGH